MADISRDTERSPAPIRLKDLLGNLVEAGVRRHDLVAAIDDVIREQRAQVVYFVERSGFVKIGTTSDLAARIASLNRGDCAIVGMTITPVRLLAVMPGGLPVERSVHSLFSRLRYDGEWFLFDEPLVSFVKALAAACEAADPATREAILLAESSARTARQNTRPLRSALSDVRRVFGEGDTFLSWQAIADRLSAANPDTSAGFTKEAISAELRRLGVPSVSGKRAGAVLRGAKITDIQAAIARTRHVTKEEAK